ncbi:MAG: ABC transporter ATP-binding protein [Alphaproteobacteria bacterium]|nr:ABC transporter ATP-binding protein [Alphaproteobacteria bacterium]
MNDAILSVENLSCHFGALIAVDQVTLDFAPGRIHAIIGPNGAGKTTLINMLSGELQPTTGRIRFRNRDITHTPAHRISRMGIGRSFQKTNVFAGFTCFENCRLAAQARHARGLSPFRPAASYADINHRAEQALDSCGLAARADAVVAEVSHGEQRQLEIAMMLATDPELLLLDEPLAGMGPEESRAMIGLLRRLAAGHTLILIEHDMDAVFEIADRLIVMVNGRILETGTVGRIRASAAVQQAYLGTGEDTP